MKNGLHCGYKWRWKAQVESVLKRRRERTWIEVVRRRVSTAWDVLLVIFYALSACDFMCKGNEFGSRWDMMSMPSATSFAASSVMIPICSWFIVWAWGRESWQTDRQKRSEFRHNCRRGADTLYNVSERRNRFQWGVIVHTAYMSIDDFYHCAFVCFRLQ